MKRWEEEGWKEDDIDKLQLAFLHDMLECKEGETVDGAWAYATYLSKVGVTPDTYPVYLRLLDTKNHWVVDALIGKHDPDTYFNHIQANFFIVKDCFRAFTQAKRGGIYPKSLLVYLGILLRVYKNPVEGYRVYPLTTTDVNNLGKHLDETKDQMYELNKNILYILDRVASLVDPGNITNDDEVLRVATQANNIRGKFLDATKTLNEAIPDLLLEKGNIAETEIQPLNIKL
jgi:hypothetical protein